MSTYPGPITKKLKTSAATPINEVRQANVIFHKMCANIALLYYNNKNDTKFELVEDEALDSSSFANSSGSWIHCSFNATEDSSIHSFFAELQYVLPSGPVTTTCKILIQAETQIGCENCKSVTHPIVGYLRGPHGNVNNYALAMNDDYTPRLPDPPAYRVVPNLNVVAWTRQQRIRGERFASRALDHYNKTNGTKFAVVHDKSTHWSSFFDTWIHTSFNASDSSAVKLFFAELKYDKFSEPVVTVCKVLEGETKKGCDYCHFKAITHPAVGYRGDFSVKTEIDSKDREIYYKIYRDEFLGEKYLRPEFL